LRRTNEVSKALEVSNLNKSLGGFRLKNISFSLELGCITGFVGANGAGKTTTIKLLLDLLKKDSGQIRYFGEGSGADLTRVKNRLGFVLDEGCLYDCLTIAEMKNLVASAYSDWDDGEFRKRLRQFSLDPKQKITTLSRGMRTKFALSLALSHHADLLIMDEPTSGLDPLVRSELLDILLEYMKTGDRCVLFSTHIVSDLERVADALILIDQGEIILQEDKDALLDTHRIVKGDKDKLSEQTRALFMNLRETDYGFEGLTDEAEAVQKRIPDALIEKASIEDIFLGYTRRRMS
jgi:ABC-2 type transport system ATP-binding protein